jgi:hypothetical protein
MDVKEIGWEGADWIHLALVRNWYWALANTVMNVWVP